MLLRSARLAVAVRCEYTRIKRNPQAKYFTYTILLQDNRLYVGATDNLYLRLLEHCLMSSASACFVKEHGPPLRLVEVVRDSTLQDERYKTLEYMSLFGWQNVRGSHYCRMEMRNPPADLKEFRRDRNDFQYMTPLELEDTWRAVKGMAQDMRRAEDMRSLRDQERTIRTRITMATSSSSASTNILPLALPPPSAHGC
jgi:predicted GIY-YIG superfamily endonuclease